MSRKLFIIAIFLFFSGCFGNSSKMTNEKNILSLIKEPNTFNDFLLKEYLFYAKTKDERDEKDLANYYFAKADQIIKGVTPYPSFPYNIKSVNEVRKITIGYEKLLKILNGDLLVKAPAHTANLFFAYESWIAPKMLDIDNSLEEREREAIFFTMLNKIEDRLNNSFEKEDEIKIVKKTIFFPFNSYRIDDRASAELVKLLRYLHETDGKYYLILAGSTDRSGKRIYNEILARKRAVATKMLLQKNGVSGDLIKITSLGESFPSIITYDNQKSKINRRVDIYVIPQDKEEFLLLPIPILDKKVAK